MCGDEIVCDLTSKGYHHAMLHTRVLLQALFRGADHTGHAPHTGPI